jgi:hypothetical protein
MRLSDEYSYHSLRYLVDSAEEGYLERWSRAASNGRGSEERVARHLVESLLDRGVSPDKIHHWVTYQKQQILQDAEEGEIGGGKVAQLILEADGLAERAEVQRDVAIPLRDFLPSLRSLLPPGAAYLPPAEAERWLKQKCGISKESLPSPYDRYPFLVINVRCTDEWDGVERAHELIEQAQAQLSLLPDSSRYESYEIGQWAWVAGSSRRFTLLERRRQKFGIPFLRQMGMLSADTRDDVSDRFADALVLLSSMKLGTTGASLASGWAAMEGLLGGSEGNYQVAEKMANILAASFVRAELTWLVHSGFASPRLQRQFTGTASRAAGILEQRLRDKEFKHTACRRKTDQLAVERLKTLIRLDEGNEQQQFNTLDGMRARLESTFNRLYRQRNIVLHGGRLGSIATSASIRMAPALVAAVFDRILASSNHNKSSDRKAPLELAALARKRLQDLRDSPSKQLARLLD